MASIIYKRFFEIRILHDYFLSSNNTSFFKNSLSDQDRLDILKNKLAHKHLDLTRDLEIKPDEKSERLLKNQRIRFARTALGLLCYIEVKREQLNDDTIVYRPLIPIDNKLKLTFTITLKNPLFSNFTLGRMKPRIPAIYHLDNLNDSGNKNFPSLSLPVEDFTNEKHFEMGELSMIGGILKEAIIENTNPGDWQNIEGSGFVSDRDRRVISRKFTYSFTTNPGLKEAEFILSDDSATDIKSIPLTGTTILQSVQLDFEKDNTETEIPPGNYQLRVTDGTDVIDIKELYLNDDLYSGGLYGIFEITPITPDADFQLIRPDGFLVQRTPPIGNEISYPIFEMRCRSRISYWRYKSDQPINPAPTDLDIVPGSADRILVSEQPRVLSLAVSGLPLDPPEASS